VFAVFDRFGDHVTRDGHAAHHFNHDVHISGADNRQQVIAAHDTVKPEIRSWPTGSDVTNPNLTTRAAGDFGGIVLQ
jgi:hypothetical protein